MYNDDVTRSIAKAAQEVLEGYGKKKMKKEEMDPTDHVKEKDGKFCVYNKDGEVVKEFKKKEAAEKYAIKNHDKLMAEVAEPEGKLGKEFKAKHKVKKSGENEDGSVTKEHKEEEEEEVDEESEKQKKYRAFFNAALKKFGVKSPAELEGDKKKEFFDYVDKNYNADNESDVDESLIGSIKKAAGAVKKKVKRAAMGKAGRAQADFDQGRKDDLDPKKRIAKKKEQIKGYVEKLKAAEKKNKDGEMDDDTLEDREDYYNGLINKAEDYIDELESQM